MTSQAQQVLEFLGRTLDAGQPAWLVTILGIWGSAPRPVGSLLALSAEQHCGSLSGGCLEQKLLEELRSGHYPADRPQVITLGVSQEQARQYRLPCGGQMRLLAEPVATASPAHEAYLALRDALSQRQASTRRIALSSGWVDIAPAPAPSANDILYERDGYVVHRLGPRSRLFIIGANLVAEQLAPLADALEMDVWVCDPRPTAFEQWPHAFTHNSTAFPDDLIREQAQAPDDMVITLAHDPRVDDMALMEALPGPAGYIGALGSRRTTDQRRARLRELGLSEQALSRLHAPVGLDIGSKTPIEIAIAIAADLIAWRHQRSPAGHRNPTHSQTGSNV